MIPTIRVNGKVHTRRSVAVRLNGVSRLTAIDSLDWSDEVPAELVGAMNGGGPPLGKALGNYTCAASLGMYLDASAAFEAELLVLNPQALGSLADAIFQLVVNVSEDARLVSTTLVNCTITSRAVTVGSDGAALVKTYALQPTMVVTNGGSLVSLVPAL
jgi:hypothetical protein